MRLHGDGHLALHDAPPELESLTGLAPRLLQSELMHFLQAIPPADQERYWNATWLSARTLSPRLIRFRYHHPERGLVQLETDSMPRRLPDGTVEWQGELRLAHLVETWVAPAPAEGAALKSEAEAVLAVVDRGGRWLELSPGLAKLLGYSREELLALSYPQICLPADWAHACHALSTLRPPARVLLPQQLVMASGALLSVRVLFSPGDGEAGGFVLQCMDDSLRGNLLHCTNLLSLSLNRVREGVFLVDEEGGFHYVNREACRMVAYPLADLMRLSLAQVDMGFVGASWLTHCRHLRDHGCVQFRSRFRGRDGRVFPVEIQSSHFVSGGRGYVLNLVRDISTQQRMEDDLRNSEARYREVFDNSPDAIFFVDVETDGRFCFSGGNPAWVRQFATDCSGLSGRNWAEPPATSSRHLILTKLRQCVESGQPIEYQEALRTETGARYIHVRLIPLRNGEQRIDRVFGLARDITPEQMAEQRRREYRRRLYTLVEHMPDAIGRFDADGCCSYLNPAARTLLGLQFNQLLRHPIEAIAGRYLSVATALRAVLATGTAQQQEVRVATPAGRKVLELRHIPENDPLGSVVGVLCMARDLTETHRSRRTLQQSHQRLREMTARQELIRDEERRRIARELHDELGQLITAIRLDIGTLQYQFGRENPVLYSRTQRTLQTLDKTVQVVRNICTALRPPALDMGLPSALEWLADDFMARSGIPCRMQLMEDADLDEQRGMALFRCAQESLTNVLKHAKASEVNIVLRRRGGSIHLSIRDNGIGFSPGHRRDRRTLGLEGIRERSLALGGNVLIRSRPGQGTCVLIRLPLGEPRLFRFA